MKNSFRTIIVILSIALTVTVFAAAYLYFDITNIKKLWEAQGLSYAALLSDKDTQLESSKDREARLQNDLESAREELLLASQDYSKLSDEYSALAYKSSFFTPSEDEIVVNNIIMHKDTPDEVAAMFETLLEAFAQSDRELFSSIISDSITEYHTRLFEVFESNAGSQYSLIKISPMNRYAPEPFQNGSACVLGIEDIDGQRINLPYEIILHKNPDTGNFVIYDFH
jgi:hypothetical protein